MNKFLEVVCAIYGIDLKESKSSDYIYSVESKSEKYSDNEVRDIIGLCLNAENINCSGADVEVRNDKR